MDEPMKALQRVVELLSPLGAEERARILRAAAAFFAEPSLAPERVVEEAVDELNNTSPRARVWMRQNSISAEQLQQV